jgi:uracil-DNA glycosylase family protein
MSSVDEQLRWSEPNDATPFLPERKTLTSLREAAAGCRGCPLWRNATQTVFGEGLKRARLMLVGEVPGDKEDRAGKPFVGPAGRELDKALEAAGIDRGEVYVTNAVKHFAFVVRGNRRLHQTPKRFHVEACRPWLDSELEVVKPEALVMLGATAGKALLGPKFKLGESRGRPLESDLAPLVAATAHPSSILRQRDDDARHEERRMFTEDLERVAAIIDGSG